MVDRIESLSEVQEEHSTRIPTVYLSIDCRKKFNGYSLFVSKGLGPMLDNYYMSLEAADQL